MARPSDAELVEVFLDATRHLTARQVQAASGVSPMTINRWRRDDWEKLQPGTREKVEKYLVRHPAPSGPSVDTLTGTRKERALKILAQAKARLVADIDEAMRVIREG